MHPLPEFIPGGRQTQAQPHRAALSLLEVLEKVAAGGMLSNGELRFLVSGLLEPVVRAHRGWPWFDLYQGQPGDTWVLSGITDLWTKLVTRHAWSAKLILARASEDPEESIRRIMWAWFQFVRREIGKGLREETARRHLTRSLDDHNDAMEPVLPEELVEESNAAESTDLTMLEDRWLKALAGKDRKPLPAFPPAEPAGYPTEAEQFFQWFIFKGLPLEPGKPAMLGEFPNWTQQAWSHWRGFRGNNGADRWKKHLEPLWLAFCLQHDVPELVKTTVKRSEDGTERLSRKVDPAAWDSHPLRQHLVRKYLVWKPDFVDASAFVRGDGAFVAPFTLVKHDSKETKPPCSLVHQTGLPKASLVAGPV